MARYGMVIDLERCYGCRACMEACKVENNTPQGLFWMRVFRLEEGEYPGTKVSYLPRPCQHCDNPPCVKVCPVEARYKRLDGLVVTDWERCIGCRYCAIACPYGVNQYNAKKPEQNFYLDWQQSEVQSATKGAVPPYDNPSLDERASDGRRTAGGGHLLGVMEKCTFCVQRVEQGLNPACVANCPAVALHFGDLDDPNSEVSKLLATKHAFRLKEELNTRPKVYYIGGEAPSLGARQFEAIKTKE